MGGADAGAGVAASGGADAGGVRVGSVHEALVERLGGNGEGVARIGGLVVFVPYALPGEAAAVRITARRPSHARAELVRPVAASGASPDRVEPPCGHFGRCGGCALMHVGYSAELRWKRRLVADALERVGKLAGVGVGETVGDFAEGHAHAAAGLEARMRYRNKARCAHDGEAVGFHEPRSGRVVDVRDCLLQKERAMAAVGVFREWASSLRAAQRGSVPGVTVRAMDGTGEAMVALDAPDGHVPRLGSLVAGLKAGVPGLACVAVGPRAARLGRGGRGGSGGRGGRGGQAPEGPAPRVVWGAGHVDESLMGCVFAVPPASFFQVNTRMAEALFGAVMDAAAPEPGDAAIDLYCGVGVATTLLAKRCARAIGVEADEGAAREARLNAARNGATNVEVIAGRAEEAFAGLPGRLGGPFVAVLDPPRRGCAASLIDAVARSGARRVAYVSCEPQTMARDLARLCGGGAYVIERVTPVDMFARTPNVESVAALRKL